MQIDIEGGVETARAALIDRIYTLGLLTAKGRYQEIQEAVDELILAVKASMPCYWEHSGEWAERGEKCADVGNEACPSCAARRGA